MARSSPWPSRWRGRGAGEPLPPRSGRPRAAIREPARTRCSRRSAAATSSPAATATAARRETSAASSHPAVPVGHRARRRAARPTRAAATLPSASVRASARSRAGRRAASRTSSAATGTWVCAARTDRKCAVELLRPERGMPPSPHRLGDADHLREALLSGPRAVRSLEVLPEELALRESFHGLCKRCAPNQEECLRKCCDKRTTALLRQGGLLPDEPLVLQQREHAGLLSARREVRDPDPRGEHRDHARDCRDLLSGGALPRQPEALLPTRPGSAQLPRSAGRAGTQPVLLPEGSDVRIGREPDVLPAKRHPRLADLLERPVRRHPLRPRQLRILWESLLVTRLRETASAHSPSPMVEALALIARLVLAGVFALAGATKLADRPGTRKAASTSGHPNGWPRRSRFCCRSPSWSWPRCSSFRRPQSPGRWVRLRCSRCSPARSRSASCAGRHPTAIASASCTRPRRAGRRWPETACSPTLAVVALVEPTPSATDWIGRFEGAELVALAVGVAAAALLAVGVVAFVTLMRSYGSVLIRLDRIESALAAAGIEAEVDVVEEPSSAESRGPSRPPLPPPR